MKWKWADAYKRSVISDCGLYVITINGPEGSETYCAFRVKQFPALCVTRDKDEAKSACERHRRER